MNIIAHINDTLSEREVGGKFAKQAAMHRAGLPVPKFFCLSREFYVQASQPIAAAIGRRLEQIDFADNNTVVAASDDIAQMFADLRLSELHRRSIEETFAREFAADTLVSVRASTVGHRLDESEDAADNPFAGMSASFLYVPRHEVVERIKQCWASGFSPESLVYRHAQGMKLTGFDVAVGVQEMVFGVRSFVLFTVDPKTAARDAVVVAGYGIGEGVVQERVGVDHYFIQRKDHSIRHELGTKDRQLSIDEDAGYGLCERPVPADKVAGPCLSDDEIVRLLQVGETIEALFGGPQDIEGTFTADGTLHILQARPIAIDYSRQLVWSNTNVTESYPGVTTALTYSHARYFYRVIFYDGYKRLGVSGEMLQKNFEPLDRMIGFINGRVYYCLSHFYLLHQQSGLFPLFRGPWEDMIGLTSSYQTHAGRGPLSLLWRARGVAKLSRALLNAAVDYSRHDRAMARYHAWWDDLIAPLRGRDLRGQDPYKLVQQFRKVWGEVGTEWGVTLTTDAYLILLYGLAEHLFRQWGLADDAGLLSDLLCGDEELISVEIILSAGALAERVRQDPHLRAAFAENSGREIWDILEAGELEADFTAAVRMHLHQFGNRGLQELRMEQPALRDVPWTLMSTVKQYADRDVTVQRVRDHELQVRREADERLRQRLSKEPAKWQLLTRLILPRLRRLIRHRENSRYCRSELFGFSRAVFNALGAYLAERGVIAKEGDIIHLSQEEIFGYIDGTGVTNNLRALVDIRREEYLANQRMQAAPEHITTLGAIPDNAILTSEAASGTGEDQDGVELRGLGSSAGRIRGTGRVVFDPNELETVDDDLILIARETDPGWLFLMLAARGIVVERGSMLSHTAITGRKFGIPTIVALPGATKRIPDGAHIEMDGSSGLVTVLEEPA